MMNEPIFPNSLKYDNYPEKEYEDFILEIQNIKKNKYSNNEKWIMKYNLIITFAQVNNVLPYWWYKFLNCNCEGVIKNNKLEYTRIIKINELIKCNVILETGQKCNNKNVLKTSYYNKLDKQDCFKCSYHLSCCQNCISWNSRKGHKKYNGYCLFCYVNLFPDREITRNYKTKEKDVVDRIFKIFPNFTWVWDKKIKDGCSKKRPDLLLDMGSHIIIVEIDENAHTDYDCSCENKRLMEISQDLGHRPIVFIRFNPDDYINKEGIKISSCWKLNRTTGLIILNQKKIIEWEIRINSLVEQINYWVKNSTEKTVEIIELFY